MIMGAECVGCVGCVAIAVFSAYFGDCDVILNIIKKSVINLYETGVGTRLIEKKNK